VRIYLALSLGCAGLAGQALPAAHKKYLGEIFARYDGSGDGLVLRTEFPGSDTQFAEIDADKNGKLTLAEFEASPAAKRLLVAFESTKKEPRARVQLEDLAARRLEHLARFDKDTNGRVTLAEWNGSDVAFRSLDLNKDGLLDPRDKKLAEPTLVFDPALLRKFTRDLPPSDQLFSSFDRDKDGKLGAPDLQGSDLAPLLPHFDRNRDGALENTEVEALVYAVTAAVRARNMGSPRAQDRPVEIAFLTLDKDKDGRLAAGEFEPRDLFARVDTDRDGFVTRAEVDRYQRSIAHDGFLQRFDLNGDARVTREEFGGALEVFLRLDKNRDGAITKADG
jgi:Ca2+-binding EF-hand superfamily protein